MKKIYNEAFDAGNEEESPLLFEMEAKPIKRNLFKKQRRYVAVYADGIHIIMDGEDDYYTHDDICDVYFREPFVEDVESRQTIFNFTKEGYCWLEDSVFPGFSENMEIVLKNEWSHYLKKREYPETVKWFVSCCAVVQIDSGVNPYIFGGSYKDPTTALETQEELQESWGFNNKYDLLDMLPKLLNGRAVEQYREKSNHDELLSVDERVLYQKIADAGGERCLWAWDLQRLILLCSLGYVCDYLLWDEALDWSLKAGIKLQKLFRNWDEFMHCYLLGYCFWSGDSIDDEDSEAALRYRMYEHYKKLPDNPWSPNWDMTLECEW